MSDVEYEPEGEWGTHSGQAGPAEVLSGLRQGRRHQLAGNMRENLAAAGAELEIKQIVGGRGFGPD